MEEKKNTREGGGKEYSSAECVRECLRIASEKNLLPVGRHWRGLLEHYSVLTPGRTEETQQSWLRDETVRQMDV